MNWHDPGQKQCRLVRLQVYNWGGFAGIHDLPVAARGFLLAGPAGPGRAALLDAITALLAPPGMMAGSLVDSVRGQAPAPQDDRAGEAPSRYLRCGTTWSALALSYERGTGARITLAQVLWLAGDATDEREVQRQFLTLERDMDLAELEPFGQSRLEPRRLKRLLPDASVRGDFLSYSERFRRLLGMGKKKVALELLRKAQGVTSLGDLGGFLRDFLLDRPGAFAAAAEFVKEWEQTSKARDKWLGASRQTETLAPTREAQSRRQELLKRQAGQAALLEAMDSYADQRRMALLRQKAERLRVEAEGLEGDISRKQAAFSQQRELLRDAERQIDETGGGQLAEWQEAKAALETRREACLHKRRLAEAACRALGRALPETPQGFAALLGEARQELQARGQRHAKAQAARDQLVVQQREAEAQLARAEVEIKALASQASNLPAALLETRRELAAALEVPESALPFAGELMQVKPAAAAWQGAIEGLMRGLALSLLVDERHYAALTRQIDQHPLGKRLAYHRVEAAPAAPAPETLHPDSLARKLDIKPCTQSAWLAAEVAGRYDYACVDSMEDFWQAERAITKEGHVRHSQTRHEKDDSLAFSDRRHWALGFANEDKLALYRQQAQELGERIASLESEASALAAQETASLDRMAHCLTLTGREWQELDAAPLLVAIDRLERRMQSALQGDNTGYAERASQVQRQEAALARADQALREAIIEHQRRKDDLAACGRALALLGERAEALPPERQRALERRFAALPAAPTLETLDSHKTQVERALHREFTQTSRALAECERVLENSLERFVREWPTQAEGLDASLAALPDFIAKLERLEAEALPQSQRRYQELLESLGQDALARLASELDQARLDIRERLEAVNESLALLPFHEGPSQSSYLQVQLIDRQLPEVQAFRQELQSLLAQGRGQGKAAPPTKGQRAEPSSKAQRPEEPAQAPETQRQEDPTEAQYQALSALAERLASLEPKAKEWRDTALDARRHVEFIGSETDAAGKELKVYQGGPDASSPDARGKSQLLGAACLAAALHYQLGGKQKTPPQYAPLVLGQAFDHADSEFAALAMQIFIRFGFQPIIAAPLKAVLPLEPYIGGACLVDISASAAPSLLPLAPKSQS